MGTIDTASIQDLKRLLELFPVANLREGWPGTKGTKEEICFSIAEGGDRHRIANFVDDHFSCCRQHVYAFVNPNSLELPAVLAEEPAAVQIPGERSLYVLRVRYSVVLREPLEETFLDFLGQFVWRWLLINRWPSYGS
jgi:hypothetical protein